MRLDPDTRKQQILEAAVEVAIADGFQAVTRESVAIRAGVAAALVSHYFDGMVGLRDAVMTAAVDRRILPVIGLGLAIRHPIALDAPRSVRRSAALAVAGCGI